MLQTIQAPERHVHGAHLGFKLGFFKIGVQVLLIALAAGALQGCDQVGRTPRDNDSACVTCHEADRDRARSADHTFFPDDCASCHTSKTSWTPTQHVHDRFTLDGAHASLPCDACHWREPVPSTCVGCHEDDRGRPLAPDHRADGFPTECGECHDTSDWAGGAR